ncbi:MAG: thiaminase II [Dehalococcoidia bacterium]|nr:thiaminase II [Dehalococcoidia bacterium]
MSDKSFSQILRVETDDIWKKVFENPFLRELQQGTLPLEKFRYYLAQDYLYLEGFGRAVALALAKAPDSRNMELLSRRVFTPVERPLHQKLMSLVDLTVEDVESIGPSPTNLAYINHMIRTAALGGLGQTAAALLPCPWSYHEIGSVLKPMDHPVYGQWVAPYTEGMLEQSTRAWRGFLDQEAAGANPRERAAMRDAFITSSRYEYLFWDMAYKQEGWPV